MKYICMKKPDGSEEIFTFPRSRAHDRMAEALTIMIVDTPDGGWERSRLELVSAGFVGPGGACHGHSETLQLSTRGGADTMLLRKQMGATG